MYSQKHEYNHGSHIVIIGYSLKKTGYIRCGPGSVVRRGVARGAAQMGPFEVGMHPRFGNFMGKKYEGFLSHEGTRIAGWLTMEKLTNVNPGLINHGLLIRGVLLQ